VNFALGSNLIEEVSAWHETSAKQPTMAAGARFFIGPVDFTIRDEANSVRWIRGNLPIVLTPTAVSKMVRLTGPSGIRRVERTDGHASVGNRYPRTKRPGSARLSVVLQDSKEKKVVS
jgi:hypothetical protein